MFVYFILPIINFMLLIALYIIGFMKMKKLTTHIDEFEDQVKSKIGSIIKGVTVCNLPK